MPWPTTTAERNDEQATGGSRIISRVHAHGVDRLLGIHDLRPRLAGTNPSGAPVPDLRDGTRVVVPRKLNRTTESGDERP